MVTDRPALEVLIKGVFDQERFLDIVRSFIVFSDETVTDPKTGQRSRALIKRVAKYHQYWAVNAAVESTVDAAAPDGDRRGGVVWHTQGSGKSLEMVFYAAKIMRDPRMTNPTLVFITDRNDLDDQLFGEVFAPATILPEKPEQADTRDRVADPAAPLLGRDHLHHAAEVRARRGRRPQPGADRTAQRRGGRRRGPPLPVRIRGDPGQLGPRSRRVWRSTFGTPCPVRPSWASPAPRSSPRTSPPGRCSATTSTSMT